MDFQKLLDLVKANEASDKFGLEMWIAPCETYGCLVGNYVIKTYSLSLTDICNNYSNVADYMDIVISEDFNLTPRYSDFLFSVFNKRGNTIISVRQYQDKDAAINRVRKFIYYFLHKQELIYDERGCVRESARRTEGNHNIVSKVAQLC